MNHITATTRPALTPKLRFPEFQDGPAWTGMQMGKAYSFKGNNSLSRDQLNYRHGSVKNIHYGDIHTKFSTLKWLLHRVKQTTHEEAFNQACTRYFDSGRRDLALFGILVRDQEAKEADLRTRGRSLSGSLQAPTRCQLIALYLPWPISRLPELIRQGGAA